MGDARAVTHWELMLIVRASREQGARCRLRHYATVGLAVGSQKPKRPDKRTVAHRWHIAQYEVQELALTIPPCICGWVWTQPVIATM